MKIFLIRHAEAAEINSGIIESDDYRYITSNGRKLTIKTAKFLRDYFKDPEKIYTSPLIRAVQTAEAIAVSIKYKHDIFPVNELRNEYSTASFQKLLKENADLESVAFVGHEPKMSYFVKILTGKRELNFSFGKTGVCLIDYDIEKETGEFKWYFNPKSREFVK